MSQSRTSNLFPVRLNYQNDVSLVSKYDARLTSGFW
jgi:hypothetical protein